MRKITVPPRSDSTGSASGMFNGAVGSATIAGTRFLEAHDQKSQFRADCARLRLYAGRQCNLDPKRAAAYLHHVIDAVVMHIGQPSPTFHDERVVQNRNADLILLHSS